MNRLASLNHLNDPVLNHAHRDMAKVRIGQTVGEALATIQGSQISSRIVYFYVVDEEDRLVGVVPTRRLLLTPMDRPISEIMVRKVLSLPSTATLVDACELFITHKLLALPILDAEHKLVGVVDVDEYTEEIDSLGTRERSEDLFQLIGIRLAKVRSTSLWQHFGTRFPWLLCNVGGGLICAFIAGVFEATLAQQVALALFIPVVLALAESVSIQSLTLTLEAQHGGRIQWSQVRHDLWRELPLGLMLGAGCGILVGATALIWQQAAGIALCLLVAITLSVTTATLLGLLVPSAMLSLQRDPRVASGPLTLALTDTLTMVYYLGLSTWWLMGRAGG